MGELGHLPVFRINAVYLRGVVHIGTGNYQLTVALTNNTGDIEVSVGNLPQVLAIFSGAHKEQLNSAVDWCREVQAITKTAPYKAAHGSIPSVGESNLFSEAQDHDVILVGFIACFIPLQPGQNALFGKGRMGIIAGISLGQVGGGVFI